MELNFLYTNYKFEELGYLKNGNLDIEIGKYNVSSNDFEITLNIDEWDSGFNVGSLFYCVGTEYGGIVQNIKVNTERNEITLKGVTYRGLLEKEYVQPPNGSAYLVLNGDANVCISNLIENRFNDLFMVLPTSGININYQVRDLNLLQALEKALGTSNAKLDIKIATNGKAVLNAVKINDLSELTQYDNNYQVNMTVETAEKQYNHILALGQGELTERLRANIYLQGDGSWGNTEYYAGLDRKTYKYENVNTTDLEKLKTEAVEKVKVSTDTLNISFEADDAELFDIVSAKEQITDISFKQPITQKILKGTFDNLSVSYKVGE